MFEDECLSWALMNNDRLTPACILHSLGSFYWWEYDMMSDSSQPAQGWLKIFEEYEECTSAMTS